MTTYTNAFTVDEVSAGFVMTYTIKTFPGTGGAVAVLLPMAVTSVVSSSMMAASSIMSFDV
ncbi:hypothetical protein H2203_003884 [Taxawa tesnikishii (nom. ined.)]|nr:hypothetical protein H2203_003884 [Dothideales sp. JES 119]